MERQELPTEASLDAHSGAASLSGGIVQLQRTIGNRAVGQMLQQGAGGGAEATGQTVSGGAAATEAGRTVSRGAADVIRRRTIVHKPTGGGGGGGGDTKMEVEDARADEEEEAELTDEQKLVQDGLAKAEAVNAEVEKAYSSFLGGNYDGASQAQIDLYKLRKYEFDSGKWTMHPSTAAGYVIEGMVNSVIGGWDGVHLQVTDLLDGTRPDVVIQLADDQFALVDITASNSAGHILDKKGSWLNHVHIPVVTESVYPSINFKSMGESKLSDEDMQAIQKRIAEKQEANELAEQEALQAERDFFDNMQNEIFDKYTSGTSIALQHFLNHKRSREKLALCGVNPANLTKMTFEEWQGVVAEVPMPNVRAVYMELSNKEI
ncbi:hypothetical protein B5M42_012140 [Paenibacillus athensensis]|uniref:Uncharacterized protein n=1 Tax=Paenibacillus athensensis TaxID=1967502 RepID=A0A4Y8Q6H8_9BACL|nr:hypothetical protein [Paenibacillus athensensis]MCD1259581.1 hypothetical protein [Paenibacillus athensensis]